MTPTESESYDEDPLYDGTNEGGQFPDIRQAHSPRAEQPVAHHREEVREDHSEQMRRSRQYPGLEKLSRFVDYDQHRTT